MLSGLGGDYRIFIAMVFIAVVLLITSVIVPTVGSEAQANRRMRQRLNRVLDSVDEGSASILRDRYLGGMSPAEKFFNHFPGVRNFRLSVMQAGIKTAAYVIILYAITLFAIGFVLAFLFLENIWIALVFALPLLVIPFYYVSYKRGKRLATFEEQLPEALDMMARALQAGHPFNETLKMVGDEMHDPIGGEFTTTFVDINYGMPIKTAFMAMLSRVPSISLNTLITAVLIQQESGGKLAEILMKISSVIRGRFKLNRKVRTLSAEGRMSAWVLTLLPFVLALVISISTPSYLGLMTKDPLGVFIVGGAFVLVIIGNFWIRKIIRFKY